MGKKLMELKHCPLCGGESEFRIVQGEEHKALTVGCKKCGAIGPKVESKLIAYMRPIPKKNMTKMDHVIWAYGEEALTAWNRRADDV